MAARGTRNMDAGEEKLNDRRLMEELCAKARKINRRAIVTAIAITLVAFVFPEI